MSPSPDHQQLHVQAADELAAHALGAPLDPAVHEHVTSCHDCAHDLATYRGIRALAGSAGGDRPAGGVDHGGTTFPGAERVWSRVTTELDAPTQLGAPAVGAGASRPRDSRRWHPLSRRAATVLTAAAAVLAAGVGGWFLGAAHTSQPNRTAQAELAARPGTAATAHGRATMQRSSDGFQMHVTTSGLPAPAGYYEVWLFDPRVQKMVAIGTLGAGAGGEFTVPAGIDTDAYDVVDVSAQLFDGNPAHGTSVLRGRLDTG